MSFDRQKIVSILVIGCGNRGEVYASYSLKHPDRAKIVGVAEPRVHTRNKFIKIHESTIEKDKIFSDWREIVKLDEKIADCVIIGLPDKLHKDAAVNFTEKGYHMLLEKPMATLLDDCRAITMASRENKSQINAVCHVLRYYAPCIKLKQLIDSGIIGNVVNINHTEPVGYWHFAHSFVRGNWHNESDSSFSLLAKCCHDIDLIIYWMNKKCVRVSSFGSLQHFRKENAPANSTDNCLTCLSEPDCSYSAVKLYKNPVYNINNWPLSVVLQSEIQNVLKDGIEDIEELFLTKTEDEKRDLLDKCLRNEKTNYGRCVYKMDNDVCDNQVVNLQFEDSSTANLTMIAFSKDLCTRKTRIYGTKGELEWDDSQNPYEIRHYDFLTQKLNKIDSSGSSPIINKTSNDSDNPNKQFIKLGGHGGSDYFLMDSFIEAVIRNDKSYVLTDVEDSFRSHLVVFAAEHSRISQKVININEFCIENNIKLNL